MGLVDGVGVLMAELVHNPCYPVVVLGSEGITDEAFELECAALALVVELIIESFGDVGVHGERWGVKCRKCLHGASSEGVASCAVCGVDVDFGAWTMEYGIRGVVKQSNSLLHKLLVGVDGPSHASTTHTSSYRSARSPAPAYSTPPKGDIWPKSNLSRRSPW